MGHVNPDEPAAKAPEHVQLKHGLNAQYKHVALKPRIWWRAI
jgi:hypothetical protein